MTTRLRCVSGLTEKTLNRTFEELKTQRVDLEGMVLKPNMVLSGTDAEDRADAEEVAQATVGCFKRTIPAAVPGIAFLSGGQGDEEATVNLDAINKLGTVGRCSLGADILVWARIASYTS